MELQRCRSQYVRLALPPKSAESSEIHSSER